MNLVDSGLPRQVNFFYNEDKRENNERLELAVEKIRERYGRYSIKPAVVMGGLKMSSDGHQDIITMPGIMYQ